MNYISELYLSLIRCENFDIIVIMWYEFDEHTFVWKLQIIYTCQFSFMNIVVLNSSYNAVHQKHCSTINDTG